MGAWAETGQPKVAVRGHIEGGDGMVSYFFARNIYFSKRSSFDFLHQKKTITRKGHEAFQKSSPRETPRSPLGPWFPPVGQKKHTGRDRLTDVPATPRRTPATVDGGGFQKLDRVVLEKVLQDLEGGR